MEASFPLLFAAVIGFGHAFEADHLIAVGNIVNRRQRIRASLKDGFMWGLGHSSTVLLIGFLIILAGRSIPEIYFSYLEAAVGLMLILMGTSRLYTLYGKSKEQSDHHRGMAYGVGLVHGLAGSGAMVLLVMNDLQEDWSRMLFLLLFGLGSIVGMMLAASMLGLPFLQRFAGNKRLTFTLTLLYAIICIGYGGWVVYENCAFLGHVLFSL